MRAARAGLGRAGWVALAVALASCRPSAEAIADGEDPLAALATPAESARYDGPFWVREAHRDSRIWRAAKGFCAKARGRGLPNCHAVDLVERWEEPLRLGEPGTPALLQPWQALPPLPAPPPLPPALHPGDPRGPGADVAALKAWEAGLAARGAGGRDAAAKGPR
jgi:hypothetical protein